MTVTLNSRADFTLGAAHRVAWGGEEVVLGAASQQAITQARARFMALIDDPEITSTNIRTEPTRSPDEGIGIVEAPRGTLVHHYCTDGNGILTKVNLIVATNFNAGPIAMSVEKAAKGMIKGGKVNDGLLNKVEMAFRAYDPCHACATHCLPGQMPLVVRIHDSHGTIVKEVRQYTR